MELPPERNRGGEIMEVESRLVPILREGVDVVKMIFFKQLKERLAQKYVDDEADSVNKLAGAVINEVFGTPSTGEPFASFIAANQNRIEDELRQLPVEFPELRIPLTDALRITFLCDEREGRGDPALLSRANDLGVLLVDREVPMPAKFMNLVRQLGGAHGLILAPVPEVEAAPSS